MIEVHRPSTALGLLLILGIGTAGCSGLRSGETDATVYTSCKFHPLETVAHTFDSADEHNNSVAIGDAVEDNTGKQWQDKWIVRKLGTNTFHVANEAVTHELTYTQIRDGANDTRYTTVTNAVIAFAASEAVPDRVTVSYTCGPARPGW